MAKISFRKGISLLSILIFSTVGLAQLPCGQNISFNTWTQEGSPSSGQWVVNGPGNSVNQTINGTSTWFVSPNDFFNVLIQGSIRVNTSNDDDLVGFVFGYQNPIGTLTTPSSTYLKTYIFDWKQMTQTFVGLTSNEGYALYEMDGLFNFNNIVSSGGGVVFPELWERTNTPNLTVLNTNYGNNGWNDFQQYDFQLKYTADSIVIWIDGLRIFEESGCYEPGKFGFYNQSQDNVVYSNFSYTFEYDFTIDDTLICINDSALFQIGSGCTNFFPSSTSFSWDFGDGTTAQGQNPYHQFTNTGTFNVQLTSIDQFGCVHVATKNIQVLPMPSANAGADDVSCSLSYQLNSINTNGTWSSSSGPILNSPNSPSCNVTVPSEGSYSFIWTTTNPAGCTDSDTVTILFSQLSASSTIIHPTCSNGTNGQVTISPQGGTSPYSYQWGASAGNQTSNIATNLSGGTHNLILTDSLGCTLSTNLTLTPPQPLSFNTLILPADCDSSNGQITITGLLGGTGSYTFNWGSGPTTSNNLQNIPSGTYSVVISDANNCDTVVNLSVPITPLSALFSSVTNISCFGESDGSATVTGPNPQGIYTYQWDNLAGASTSQTVTNLAAGTYSVIVSSSPNCSDTLFVAINEPPILEIVMIPDTFVCEGTSINLFANASGGTPGYSYIWNNSLGTGQSHIISPSQDSTYTCTVIDANGCFKMDSMTVEMVSNPVISFISDTNQACLFPAYDFSFIASSNDPSVSLTWDFGDGISGIGNPTSHTYSSSGSYIVTLQGVSQYGCESQSIVQTEITVHPNPIANFTFTPTNPTTLLTTVNFINLSTTNITDSHWSFGANNFSDDKDPSFTFPEIAGTHSVFLEVENEYGCTDSISRLITINEDIIIYAPNSFTPDNNEHNQNWFVVMSGIDIYSVEISIYNRWGELIWFSQDLETPWDGTYGGKIVPDGIYIWTVKAKDSFSGKKYEFNGHVNVLR